jgi:hypothetical protein
MRKADKNNEKKSDNSSIVYFLFEGSLFVLFLLASVSKGRGIDTIAALFCFVFILAIIGIIALFVYNVRKWV